jgi:hypothetical protein
MSVNISASAGTARRINRRTSAWQRIIHFAGLATIRQIIEIVKKTCRPRNRRKLCPVGIHHRAPPATQWMTTDSALGSFVTNFFTRLPCHTPSGGLDRTILLWDPVSGRELACLEGDGQIGALAALPHGHLVVGEALGLVTSTGWQSTGVAKAISAPRGTASPAEAARDPAFAINAEEQGRRQNDMRAYRLDRSSL